MKPILFIDFHGTLSHEYFWRSLDVKSRKEIEDMLFVEPNLTVRNWMKGEYTSEEINRLVAERLGLNYEELWKVFVADCNSMNVPAELLNEINFLRDRYHTVLLTDNMDCFSRFVVPSLRLDQFFDYIANSSEEKISKNENSGEAFRRHVLRLESDIQKCVLIDDSQSVCALFERLGGKSLLVTKEESLIYWLKKL